MVRLIVLVSLFAALSGSVGAADSLPDAQAAEPDQGRNFLWRAMGSNGTEVFLLGSIHALPEDAYPLAVEIDEAFASAHSVYFEVDMEDTSALGGRMMAVGALPPEKRLSDVLDSETRDLLEAYLEKSGLSFGTVEAMKPWMAALVLTSIELMKAGFSADAGLDLHLAGRAHQEGKEVGAFETADYQIALFSEMDEDSSRAFLRYSLKDMDNVVSQLESLTEAWKRGNVAELSVLLTESFSDEPELFERLVTVRNLAWLPRVEELLKGDATAMVVVGALHLVGPGGLIEMLRDQGYRVEQL
ncbi:MAG: TraB/GumN family protein [Acidobacteriota bacterium]